MLSATIRQSILAVAYVAIILYHISDCSKVLTNNFSLDWKIIDVFDRHLLVYAIVDFAFQTVAQLPIIPEQSWFWRLGINKVYVITDEKM